MIQRHMERLQANPRLNEVDPDALRWTPATTLNAVLSEEEREAEMDVRCLVRQEKPVPAALLETKDELICVQVPVMLLLDVCLISWGVQIAAINGQSMLAVSRHLMLCKIALNQFTT